MWLDFFIDFCIYICYLMWTFFTNFRFWPRPCWIFDQMRPATPIATHPLWQICPTSCYCSHGCTTKLVLGLCTLLLNINISHFIIHWQENGWRYTYYHCKLTFGDLWLGSCKNSVMKFSLWLFQIVSHFLSNNHAKITFLHFMIENKISLCALDL